MSDEGTNILNIQARVRSHEHCLDQMHTRSLNRYKLGKHAASGDPMPIPCTRIYLVPTEYTYLEVMVSVLSYIHVISSYTNSIASAFRVYPRGMRASPTETRIVACLCPEMNVGFGISRAEHDNGAFGNMSVTVYPDISSLVVTSSCYYNPPNNYSFCEIQGLGIRLLQKHE